MIKTIEENKQSFLQVKKSKFYTYLFAVENEEQIQAFLSFVKKEHKKATHIVYAYILHSPNKEKYYDASEPNGTAGKSMFNVLKKNELTNVLAVCARYFGGVKLGAGGLLRAYSKTVSLCINTNSKE